MFVHIPVVLAFLSCALAAGTGDPRVVRYAGRTMGTVVQVAMLTRDSSATAADAAVALRELARVDSLMSNWTRTSEVARINREAAQGPIPVDAEVADVLEEALAVGRASDGAFDVTVEPLVRAWGFLGGRPHVPADSAVAAAMRNVGADKIRFDPTARTMSFARDGVQVDLGGIAKGHGVDRAAARLREHGVRDALIDLSGNMVAMGSPTSRRGWRVGIRDPRDRVEVLATLELRDVAVSTSGIYEQFVAAGGRTYGHIMDPRSGRPAEGLISVTVVAASARAADAWSTALFVLGPVEAMRVARERDDIAVVLVRPGPEGLDQMWVERALRGRFTILAAGRPLLTLHEF